MIFKKSEDIYYTVGNAGDPVGPVLRTKMYETMMQEEKAGVDQVIQILQEKLDLYGTMEGMPCIELVGVLFIIPLNLRMKIPTTI